MYRIAIIRSRDKRCVFFRSRCSTSVQTAWPTEAVVAELSRSGLDQQIAGALAEAFPSALTGAIGEVFLVAAAVVVLAFGLSLFLRSENDEEAG